MELLLVVQKIYPLSHFVFSGGDQQVLKTLFAQEMLKEGFLAQVNFYASFAHKDSDIDKYLIAVDKVFAFIAAAIKSGKPKRYLKGPVCHSGFKRLT